MQYSISQAASVTGTSAHTLRYYEKEGLLPMVSRSAGNIRVFEDSDIRWLRLIGCLKASGLSLHEIKQYIDWAMEGDSTLEERRQLFYSRREAVREQMEALRRTLNALDYKCWYYDMAVAAGTDAAPSAVSKEDLPENIRRALENSDLEKNG